MKKYFVIGFRALLVISTLIGLLIGTGITDGNFRSTSFVYYTNLSNLVVLVFYILILVLDIKDVCRKEEIKNHYQTAKGAITIMILVTGLIYNILLRGGYNLSGVILHVTTPLAVIVDYIVFDKKGDYTKYSPLMWLIIPYLYIPFIYIRGAIVKETSTVKYPYFFLDVDKNGVGVTILWIVGLTVFFIILGYLIYFFDKKLAEKKQKDLA